MIAIGGGSRACLLVAAHLLVGLVAAGPLQGQPTTPATYNARSEMVRARQSLESGNFRDAEVVYAAALSRISPLDATLRAGALFGHAFAVQQRLVAGDTLDGRVAVDSIVREYADAAELNPDALGAAAANNAGLVLRAVERHEDAKRHFLTAAAQAGPQQATLYVQAGREFESLGAPDSARWAYRRALMTDSTSQGARRALLELFARNFAPDSLLAAATRWRADSASARASSGALLTLLTRESQPISAPAARRALILLCDSWPVFAAGPSYFAVAFSAPLQRAAQLHPELRDGVLSVADAYAPRRDDRLYVEPGTARWWRSESGPDGARATWSALLRSIGDGYNQRDERRIARSYYEAAIGWGDDELSGSWVDRRAFLPLALLYAEEKREPDSEKLQHGIAEFTNRMFAAKGEAYRRGDLEQIRDFHLTLGALYAARKEWAGPGAQNAEFQLERMRSASVALQQRTGRTVADPPELLEKLAIRYKETGRTDKATDVTRQIRQHYIRVQRPDAAAEVERRVNRTAVITPQVRPAAPRPTPATPQPGPATPRPSPANAAVQRPSLVRTVAPKDSPKPDSARRDSARTDTTKRALLLRARPPIR